MTTSEKEPMGAREVAELTTSFVQCVPDKCDRITWRGHYYHLPLQIPAASLPSAAEQRAGPQRDELGWFPAEAEHGNPAPYIPSIAAHSVASPAAGAEVASLLITLHSAAKGGVKLDRFQIATIASLLESLSAQAEALRHDVERHIRIASEAEQRASSLQAEVEAVKASGDGRVS